MGSNNSQTQNPYSTELPNTKSPGFSSIYRNAQSLQQLSQAPSQGLKSMKDMVVRSFKEKYPKNDFIGQILIKKNDQDNSEERNLMKFTYEQVYQMSEHLGSNILTEKLYHEEHLHNMKLIGIFSKNRYEWLVADIACMLYGLTIVPLYDTLGIESLTYCFQNSEMTSCFVTASTIQILLNLEGHGNLKHLISFDKLNSETQLRLKKHGFTLSYFEELIKKPEKFIDHETISVEPNSCLTFSYTSGTTGPPKGAMISHQNFLSFLSAFENSEVKGFKQDDVYLSFLPLPHVFERVVQCGIMFFGASSVFFNGDVTKIKDDAAFVRPTIFVGVPRIFNRITEAVQQKITEAGGLKACLFNTAYQTKRNKLHKNGDFTCDFYDKVVFSKIREGFGGRVRLMLSGSAPLRSQVFQFMKIIMGCPFYEGYGQTENTGAAFMTHTYDPSNGHVGGVTTNLEFKLADLPEMEYTSQDKDQNGKSTPKGQIWLRGPAVFLGYYKQPDKTQQALTEDGWLRTGDVGMLLPETKALKIIDRKKNIFKLQQGEYVASEKVEAIYSKSPLVSQVFIHGESTNNFAIGIVSVQKEQLQKIAKSHKIEKDYEELCSDKQIRKLVCKELNKIGKDQGLKGFEQAKNVYIEPKSFQEQGILTNTLKLQRFAAKKKYAQQIAQMYADGPYDGKK